MDIIVEKAGPYRAAYWTDGLGEVVLTGPEHQHLPDDELFDEASRLAKDVGIDLSRGRIVVGLWRP